MTILLDWLLRKAAAVIAFTGCLRTHELMSLKFEDVMETNDGLWISYMPAK